MRDGRELAGRGQGQQLPPGPSGGVLRVESQGEVRQVGEEDAGRAGGGVGFLGGVP